VLPFKDNGRARVVGETTGGSSGQPYILDLADGMLAFVGAKRESFPDGSRFEGVGIRPDVEVAPTVDDIRAGRDVALDAARRLLLAPPTRVTGPRPALDLRGGVTGRRRLAGVAAGRGQRNPDRAQRVSPTRWARALAEGWARGSWDGSTAECSAVQRHGTPARNVRPSRLGRVESLGAYRVSPYAVHRAATRPRATGSTRLTGASKRSVHRGHDASTKGGRGADRDAPRLVRGAEAPRPVREPFSSVASPLAIHSRRRATRGSSRAARSAGSSPAPTAIASITAAAAVMAAGLVGATP
jgi:hypothetical protein